MQLKQLASVGEGKSLLHPEKLNCPHKSGQNDDKFGDKNNFKNDVKNAVKNDVKICKKIGFAGFKNVEK